MEEEVLPLKQMLCEAKLNEATSRLKLYHQRAGDQAVTTLKELVAAIQKDIDSAAMVPAAERTLADVDTDLTEHGLDLNANGTFDHASFRGNLLKRCCLS